MFWETVETAGRVLFDPRVQRVLEDTLGHRGNYTTSYFLEFDWSSAREIGVSLAETFIIGMASNAIEDFFGDNYPGLTGTLVGAASAEALEQTYSVLRTYQDYRSGNLAGAVVGTIEQAVVVAQTIAEAIEVHNDLGELSAQSLSDSAFAAQQILRLQEMAPDGGLELALNHSSSLRQIGFELTYDETSWNVDYGRKLVLISQFLRIAALQQEGRETAGDLTSVRELVAEFEDQSVGALGAVGDRLVLGIRNDEYVDFANETARLLGVTGW